MGSFYKMGDFDGMYNSWGSDWGMGFGLFGGMMLGSFMLVVIVWTVYWKYRALWHAAKHDNKWWFIGLLIVNTLGILEILYLYVFSKKTSMFGHDEKNVPMMSSQQAKDGEAKY